MGAAGSKVAFAAAAVVLVLALTCALAQTAGASRQDDPPASPLAGDASWIWYVSASGGSGAAIGESAKRRGLGSVFVKSGDGGNYWSQFSPELVDEIHAAGVDVCAWQFVYGNDPAREARVGARAVDAGADCLIIDAESDYQGKYAAADTYITKLRRRIGADFPLVLASFPYVDYHPSFPYSVFLGPGGAQYNAPQLYWYAIGDTVASAFDHTYTFNRPYDRPIYPVGQTYENPPRKQLEDFRRYARASGSAGVSWWSWQETSGSEWRAITKRPGKALPPQLDDTYPELARGARGDLVVWAQQLLAGGGYKAPINGRFNGATERAVLALQTAVGLPASGVIGEDTWPQLLELTPQRVHWARRGGKADRGRPRRVAAGAPASASLPPLGQDLPPIAERAPAPAAGGDAGPLAFQRIRADQKILRLQFDLRFKRPIPSLRRLGPHPRIDLDRPARFLCVDVQSDSTGRLLLCPAGKVKHGRVDVGVSKLHGGKPRGAGKISASVERQDRSLRLRLPMASIGLKPGKLRFSALSGWSGAACASPGRGGPKATCRDRAPTRGEASRRIRPVRAVGCGDFSTSKVFNGPRSSKRVALTFDDGPSPYTEQILSELDRFGVHATFFQIGQQVPAYPDVERKILAQGSELANHSLHHEDGPGVESLRRTSELIAQASGFHPCMFRPPGGYDPPQTLAAVRSLGLVTTIWDVDTRDYTLPGTGTIIARATSVNPGSIVLMHDGGGNRSETAAAVPAIIKNLRSRGYKLVTMTKLLGGHYKFREVKGRRLPARHPLPEPRDFPVRIEGP
ncbi:MAG: polysaccharide deacetylase family protein [Solirubrobacterales bacterium]